MTGTHDHVLAIVCSPACPAWAQTVDDMPGLSDDQHARDRGLGEGEPSPRMTDPTPESRLLIPEEYTRGILAEYFAPSPLEALLPAVDPAPKPDTRPETDEDRALALVAAAIWSELQRQDPSGMFDDYGGGRIDYVAMDVAGVDLREVARAALATTQHTTTEYGYRLPDGREIWQEDHGTDGTWTPDDFYRSGMRAVDILADEAETVRGFRYEFGRAHIEGVVIRRRVHTITGPTEEVPA